MNPISIITLFVTKVAGYVKSGIDWRHWINGYETKKADVIPKEYAFKIIPLDFVPVRRSKFENDRTTPGSSGDYAHTMIKVKDIHPFILSAHSSFLVVQSFRKTNLSVFNNQKLNISAAYIVGTNGKLQIVDANHYTFDKAGTHGYLDFYTDTSLGAAANRKAHTIHESGRAYALAPNVKPNVITKLEALVNGKLWIYGVIILLIVITLAIIEKEKNK